MPPNERVDRYCRLVPLIPLNVNVGGEVRLALVARHLRDIDRRLEPHLSECSQRGPTLLTAGDMSIQSRRGRQGDSGRALGANPSLNLGTEKCVHMSASSRTGEPGAYINRDQLSLFEPDVHDGH